MRRKKSIRDKKVDIEIIREAWRQKCEVEDDWNITRFSQWFYTIKAIICLLLNRQKSLYANMDIPNISVCIWDYHTGCFEGQPFGHDWTQLQVGGGYFTNWYYDIFFNGDY